MTHLQDKDVIVAADAGPSIGGRCWRNGGGGRRRGSADRGSGAAVDR
jgi:hypothetical protein